MKNEYSNRLAHLTRREQRSIIDKAKAWRESDSRCSHDKLLPVEHYIERLLNGERPKDKKTLQRAEPRQIGLFTCTNCGEKVATGGGGTEHRNHCPWCLHSLHLDNEPGDRKADCGGAMEPVAVWVRKGGEWALIHRCKRCGALSSNRIAADDNAALLLSIAARPIASPPFPLERLKESVSQQETPRP